MSETLPRLIYAGKPVRPVQAGYTTRDPYGAVVTNIPGGLSRVATDHLSGVYEISATYQLSAVEYLWWGAFYHTTLKEGSMPFIAELALDTPVIQEYVCQIVAQPSKPRNLGFYTEVTLTLEAEPIIDDAYNGVIVDIVGGGYGDETMAMLNLLDLYANTWCPEYLAPTPDPAPNLGVVLDFINARYYKNAIAEPLSAVLTTTRASGGTDFSQSGELLLFGSNEPRVGGGGLLVEQSSTNRVPNSYSPTGWARTLNGTITEVVDGQSNAKTGRGVATGSGAFRLTSSQDDVVNVLAGDVVFCSVRFKITPDCVFRVRVADPTFRGERGIDLNGSSVFGILPYTATVRPDGYVNTTVSYTSTGPGQVFFEFYIVGVGGTTAPPPSGAVCYMQLPQVEASRSTSYIARAADSGLRSSEFLRSSLIGFDTYSGTAFIEFYWDGESYNRGFFTLSDNTINHQVRCRALASGQFEVILFESGATLGFHNFNAPPVGVVRVAVSYSPTQLIMVVNGVAKSSVPSGSVTSINQMSVGSRHVGAEPLNGKVRKAWYKPDAYTEQQLIEITQ